MQIDPLGGMNPVLNAVAMAANNPAALGGVGAYPGSLAGPLSGTAPGSPARNFPQLGQINQPPQGPSAQQPAYPALPAALSSQLQGDMLLFIANFISKDSNDSYIWRENYVNMLAICWSSS